MTKKPFKTFFKPISMNSHQRFFMEILARHQWEASYLWPFTDLIYLLEQEQVNIDPETYVKELVVSNPIILNTLRTTIKQETKKQFNKSISHTYTNKIFPLATKTELRQGGRKQSVQTLIKLIHSVEKYYDEHNGHRKDSKANTIKEDPKKWTWQLYQELNQALRHPSAVHQKLFYQNYSTLENRSMTKKQSKNFHVDQYDVIKQLEILLLPAIENTRRSQERATLKRSSKLKGNLQGGFKNGGQVEPFSMSQIKNLLLRTSRLKKNSIDQHRILRSKIVHNRMIKTLLSRPQNQQHLRKNSYRPIKREDIGDLTYFERLQEESPNRVSFIKTEKSLMNYEQTNRHLTQDEANHQIIKINQTLKQSHLKNLIYKESLQREHFQRESQQKESKKSEFGVEATAITSTVLPILERKLENSLKTILRRVSLQTDSHQKEFISRESTTLISEKNNLATFVKSQKSILDKAHTNRHLTQNEESYQILKINQTLKQSHLKNLIYKESLQRENQQKEVIQKQKALHEQEVLYKQEVSDAVSAALPVLENKLINRQERHKEIRQENSLKTILRRVSLLNQAHTNRHLTQNEESHQILKTNQTLKQSHLKNLIYKESLQRESLKREIFQKESFQSESQQKEVIQKQKALHEQAVSAVSLKTILKRVSLQMDSRQHDFIGRESSKLISEKKTLVKESNQTLKQSYLKHLVYKEGLQRESRENVIRSQRMKKVNLEVMPMVIKALTKGQLKVSNVETKLSEKEIEAIEALRAKIAVVKETEQAELAYENLLVTSSRNLVVRNRQESESRHVNQKLQRTKTLTTKSFKVEHQEIPSLVQAVSKSVDKTWIREMIKASSLEELSSMTERNVLTNKNTINEITSNTDPTNATSTTISSNSTDIFEIDAQKIDFIAEQVFRRVTDKFERERKRRGM